MKTGKYIPLGEYKNIKIGYGTVDFVNLKTIYLRLNSWIQPSSESDYEDSIKKSRKQIKDHCYYLNNQNFNNLCIVDLDIKTKGLKLEKRSFMNLEITLFVKSHFDVRSKQSKSMVKSILYEIIDDCLEDKNLFNFNRNKKIT
jgi:hypothetical protein